MSSNEVTKHKMMFGFSLLVMLSILAAIIALGKVEQQTSYGLNIILGSIATLAGGFSNWAFGHLDDSKEEENGKAPSQAAQ